MAEELSTRNKIKELQAELAVEQAEEVKVFLDWMQSEKGAELKDRLLTLQGKSVPGSVIESQTQNMLQVFNDSMGIFPNFINVQQPATMTMNLDGSPLFTSGAAIPESKTE